MQGTTVSKAMVVGVLYNSSLPYNCKVLLIPYVAASTGMACVPGMGRTRKY